MQVTCSRLVPWQTIKRVSESFRVLFVRKRAETARLTSPPSPDSRASNSRRAKGGAASTRDPAPHRPRDVLPHDPAPRALPRQKLTGDRRRSSKRSFRSMATRVRRDAQGSHTFHLRHLRRAFAVAFRASAAIAFAFGVLNGKKSSTSYSHTLVGKITTSSATSLSRFWNE